MCICFHWCSFRHHFPGINVIQTHHTKSGICGRSVVKFKNKFFFCKPQHKRVTNEEHYSLRYTYPVLDCCRCLTFHCCCWYCSQRRSAVATAARPSSCPVGSSGSHNQAYLRCCWIAAGRVERRVGRKKDRKVRPKNGQNELAQRS